MSHFSKLAKYNLVETKRVFLNIITTCSLDYKTIEYKCKQSFGAISDTPSFKEMRRT